MNEEYDNYEFKEAVLEALNDYRDIRTKHDKIQGVCRVSNRKDTKYGDKLLNQYREGMVNTNTDELTNESTQVVRMDAERLKDLFKMVKTSNADSVAFVVTDKHPLISLFIRENQPDGVYLQAPKIHSEEWSGFDK